MSRYPKAARAATIKCIACNAPVVQTIEGRYVCVECGESPVRPRRSKELSVETDGVSVNKHVRVAGEQIPRVTYTIDSDNTSEVNVRVRDTVPDGVARSDIVFPDGDGDRYLLASGDVLEYNRTIGPDESVEATYLLPTEVDDPAPFEVAPSIVSVVPVRRELVDDGAIPPGRNGDAAQGQMTGAGRERRRDPIGNGNGNGNRNGEGNAVSDSDGSNGVTLETVNPPTTTGSSGAAEEGFLVGLDSDVEPVISVVLPTMNEEGGIGTCIERVKEALATLELTGEIIVSDSSTDRTPEIAREMGAIVVEPDRKGYGYAYRYAFERARGRYIVMGDADTTYDFGELPKLFERASQGADVVLGSRFEGRIKPGAMPWLHRYVGNPILTKFLNVFYDADVSDAHSGFRVFTREALDRLDVDTDGMEFASEMIMEATTEGLTIEEVPITYHEREGEAKLDSFGDGWRHLKFMLINAPGYLFSIPGTAIGAFGVLLMALSFFDVSFGAGAFGPYSMIAGALTTIVGYQVASLGIFATVASDPIRRPQDAVTRWIVDHLSLERGASIGLAAFGIGATYATYLIVRGIQDGVGTLPLLKSDMLAFTLIVLGVQTVFSSFFMSAIAEN